MERAQKQAPKRAANHLLVEQSNIDNAYVLAWQGFCGTGIKDKPIPQIVQDVQSFLKSREHTCAMFNLSKEKLTWCCKDECEVVKMQKQMDEEQQKQEDFASELVNKGHHCVVTLESYPVQIQWCKQEPCIG